MISLKTLIEYIDNKSVILVGNADYINKDNYSNIIDSYQIVVRMNHAAPNTNIGFKTNLWLMSYNNINIQPVEYGLFHPNYIIRLNENEYMHDSLRSVVYVWPKKDHDIFEKELGSLPSTGCMSIYFFLNYLNCKDLNIIGFDFFKSGSFYNNDKKLAHKYHNSENEEKYINNCIEQNKIKRIK